MRLAVIAWRWRRVLRYELGAIRERADEAVAEWAERQRKARAKAQEDARLFASPETSRGNVPLPPVTLVKLLQQRERLRHPSKASDIGLEASRHQHHRPIARLIAKRQTIGE